MNRRSHVTQEISADGHFLRVFWLRRFWRRRRWVNGLLAWIVADHNDFHIHVGDLMLRQRAPFLDSGRNLISRGCSRILEITAVDDVRAVGEPTCGAYEREARAHMRCGTERDMATGL